MPMDRVIHNPAVMGGKPCIRGLRVTVGTILGLLASGQTREPWKRGPQLRIMARMDDGFDPFPLLPEDLR